MIEPYRSQFRELLIQGAGTADVQDLSEPVGFAVPSRGQETWIARELDRVRVHQTSLCVLLEDVIQRADRILDVGCGTGATTVAMALSTRLRPSMVIGLDPNNASLDAARVRALGHEVPDGRISFEYIEPTCILPQENGKFDLTVSVSAIEYINDPEMRPVFVSELVRVTRPGGYIYLSTPNPLRFREHHTGRIFGNQIHRDGYPWANPPWELNRMFGSCDLIPLGRYFAERASKRLGLPLPVPIVGSLLPWFAPWLKILARKHR